MRRSVGAVAGRAEGEEDRSMKAQTRRNEPVRPVTMREVGRAAGGYHHSTVSLALRNDPAIRASVRDRIQRAARDIGYHRDPLLDAFNRRRHAVGRPRRSRVIAVIGGFATRLELERSARERAIWSGAAVEAQRLGFQLEYFPLGPGRMTAKRLDAVLYARGIRGVCFLPFGPETTPPELTWVRYGAVKIECGHFPRPEFTIAPALLQGVGEGFEALRQRGFRRIGLAIKAGASPLRADLVTAGFLLIQQGVPGGEQVPPGVFREPRTNLQIRTWLRRHRPDAVLAEPGVGRAVAEMAARLGLSCASVPIDAVESSVGAIRVMVDYERLGAVAVDRVAALMRTHSHPTACGTFTTFVATACREGSAEKDHLGNDRAAAKKPSGRTA